MSIIIPPFEKKEVEIRETYIDEEGKTRERIKKVMVPTGKLIEPKNNSKNPKGMNP